MPFYCSVTIRISIAALHIDSVCIQNINTNTHTHTRTGWLRIIQNQMECALFALTIRFSVYTLMCVCRVYSTLVARNKIFSDAHSDRYVLQSKCSALQPTVLRHFRFRKCLMSAVALRHERGMERAGGVQACVSLCVWFIKSRDTLIFGWNTSLGYTRSTRVLLTNSYYWLVAADFTQASRRV